MDDRTYKLIGADYPGNRETDIKNPGLWWMMGFLFVVSFLGLFSLVPLRKVHAPYFAPFSLVSSILRMILWPIERHIIRPFAINFSRRSL